MRTPTPDLDRLNELHGTGARFANADDAGLVIYETRVSLKTGQHVDVSWVAIDQVVHAIQERYTLDEPSPYLKPAVVVDVPLVTGADLRLAMPSTMTVSEPVTVPAPPVAPKKGFWSRIAEAARG